MKKIYRILENFVDKIFTKKILVYVVKVTITTQNCNNSGMVIDFGKLKTFQTWLDEYYDHHTILNIKDEKLETVMNILNNLKDGLIDSIEVDGVQTTTSTFTKYQPKTNKVVYENEKPQGKYLSASAYKAKLVEKSK